MKPLTKQVTAMCTTWGKASCYKQVEEVVTQHPRLTIMFRAMLYDSLIVRVAQVRWRQRNLVSQVIKARVQSQMEVE